MEFLRSLVKKINDNIIARNLVLAFCGIIVFVFIVSILLNLFTRHGQVNDVPSFAGMTLEEAKKAARKESLKLEINDSIFVAGFAGGTVLEQTPQAGAKVKSGRRIFVTINAFAQKKVTVPYVAGYSLRQAKNNLEVAGLEIEKLIYREDLATNNVLEQRYDNRLVTPGSDIQAPVGSGVVLVVGLGENGNSQAIPRLIGYSIREAKSRLWEVGFNVGAINLDADITPLNITDAKVYSQTPNQGYRYTLGTSVSFAATLDQAKVDKGLKESTKIARQITDSIVMNAITEQ